MFAAAFCKSFGLRFGPTVARMAAGAGQCPPFDGDQTSTAPEHPTRLSKPGIEVGPVMHGGDGPHD